MTMTSHDDIHRDIGRMEGRLDAMEDRLGKMEVVLERIDGRLAKIEADKLQISGGLKVGSWVWAFLSGTVGAVATYVAAHFLK